MREFSQESEKMPSLKKGGETVTVTDTGRERERERETIV